MKTVKSNVISGVNTEGLKVGDKIYLDPLVEGGVTTIPSSVELGEIVEIAYGELKLKDKAL